MQGPVHLILGATGAVGSATARRLAARGARLALSGRNRAVLDPLAAELGALALPSDATVSADVDAAVKATLAHHGRLDGAVNCVGSVLLKPAHLTKDEEFQAVLTTNLLSSFYLLRATVKAMGNGGGSLVFCSTAAAHGGLPNHEAIAAAKAGIEGLMNSAAATYASKNIRINCVAPGLVRSGMTARIVGSEGALKASLAMHPLGRIGEPDDVARVIDFLLDPANSWMTAQCIAVDGGLGSLQPRATA
jgi:3-oxoacyl-[acyl-carrier protein] reductase